ncbi:MAG: hypothetical protein GF353_02210, partial [Candidatus Lokiarchaeota archaeon]|nr:hypothetical protein [Candidatus Lokiarchaeota archaeon]
MKLNRIRNYFPIILCFLGPIVIAFAANIEFICNLHIPFNFLDGIIVYLSEIRSLDWLVNLLIGTITAFAIFFALVPLGYSTNYLPKKIIREYIFKNINTYCYLSVELSFSLVVACFTQASYIYNINLALCISYTILAVITSVFYFYWLTQILIPGVIYSNILNKIDFAKARLVEDKLSENRARFRNDLQNFNKIKTEAEDPLELIARNPYRISTTMRGLITSIDVHKIDKLLSDFKNNIFSIIIHANIGDSIPINMNITESWLLTINLNTFKDGSIEDKTIKEKLEILKKDLRKCFEIDERLNVFEDYYKPLLSDLLLCYEHLVNSDEIPLKFLLDGVQKFIRDEYFISRDEKWNTELSIKQQIFRYLVDELTDLDKYQYKNIPLNELLTFIYYLQQLAIQNKNRTLMNSILKSMSTLFFRTIISQKKYSPQLASYILNIREISVSYNLQKKFENENPENLEKEKQSFYDPIINQGLQTAFNCYSYLIHYHYANHPSESYKYLTINAQYLIDFVTPLYSWENES